MLHLTELTPAPLVSLLMLLRGPVAAESWSERDRDVLELVLTIFRNILAAPDPPVRVCL
jgi:hypothetical protein